MKIMCCKKIVNLQHPVNSLLILSCMNDQIEENQYGKLITIVIYVKCIFKKIVFLILTVIISCISLRRLQRYVSAI